MVIDIAAYDIIIWSVWLNIASIMAISTVGCVEIWSLDSEYKQITLLIYLYLHHVT